MTAHPPAIHFGRLLAAVRARAGFKGAVLARRLGISPSALSSYESTTENGRILSLGMARRYLAACGATLDEELAVYEALRLHSSTARSVGAVLDGQQLSGADRLSAWRDAASARRVAS